MKKYILFLIIIIYCISLSGCSDKKGLVENIVTTAQNPDNENSIIQSDETNDSTSKNNANNNNDTEKYYEIDVDLTELNSIMVYSEIYNMMYTPEKYINKSIRLEGQFLIYYDEENDKNLYAVLVSDATQCCQQGMEVVFCDDYGYPDDYPDAYNTITVTGVFEVYKQDGAEYCRLSNCVWR